jgi:hypothetical protein
VDKIEPQMTDVSAVAMIGTQAFVLRLDRSQLASRGPGHLVTAEVVTVIPTSEGDG